MALSTATYTILRLNSDVLTTFGTRIYPGVAPKDATMPYIVYDIDDIQSTMTNTSDLKFDIAALMVTIVTDKYSLAETYAGYVRTALDRYKGTQDTEKILNIEYISQSPSYDDEYVTASGKGIVAFMRDMRFDITRQG